MAAGDVLMEAFALDDWPWGGSSGNLYIFNTEQFTDQNGMPHLSNVQEEIDQPLQICPILVAGRQAVVQAFTFQPTKLSVDRRRARRTGVIFDQFDTPQYDLFQGWRFPDLPNPMTWKDLALYNLRARCRPQLETRYGTWDDILALFAGIQFVQPGDLARLPTAVGRVMIVGGAAVVGTALVTALSVIQLTPLDANISGIPRVIAQTPGVSFTIETTDMGDNGLCSWSITEPF